MANNDIHINQNYEQLMDTLTQKGNVLVGVLSMLGKNAKAATNQFNKLFGNKTNEEIKDLLASSKEFADLYDKLQIKMEEYATQIDDISQKISTLATRYRTSEEEMGKYLDKIKEYADTKEQIDILSQSLSGLTSGTTEYARVKAALDDAQKRENQISRTISSTNIGKQILDDFTNNDADLQDMVTSYRNIHDETDDIRANMRDIDNAQAQINAKTKTWEKGLQAVNTTFRTVVGAAKDGIKKLFEINHAVSTISREMGMTTSQMKGMQDNILNNYGKMANKLGMTFADIFKFQETYSRNIGRATVLTNEQVESFAMLSKVAGEGAVNDMAKNMDDFGMSSSSAVDYLTLNMARAANQGLSIKDTSEKFAKNIKMASQYTFKKGVDGINKMTLLSQRLKFNMESIGSAIDKFSTIEGAISTSANLQVLGGSYAASFANPMQAMGEALLDAEAFTKRIVGSVAQNAVFNRQTGSVEMSPPEKAKLKEVANQLGISYDEMFNMASQQAKIGDIENELRGSNFTDEQKAFLANTAQYDAASKTWRVTKMTDNGAEDVDIKSLNQSDIAALQKENDFEKSVQSDVHAIRSKLDKYLEETTFDTKSYQEQITGLKEASGITMAKAVAAPTALIMGGLKSWQRESRGMWLALFAILGGKALWGVFGDGIKQKGLQALVRGSGRALGGGAAARGAAAGGGAASGAAAGGLGAAALTVGAAAGGILALEENIRHWHKFVKGKKNYQTELDRIKNDDTLSDAEKDEQLKQAIRNQGKLKGKAIGSTVGAIVGGIGGFVVGGPAGAAIGAGLGSVAGQHIGGWIGGRERKKYNLDGSQQPQKTEIRQKPQYEKKTHISTESVNLVSNNGKIGIDDMKIDISGTIKLTADGGKSADVDINKLMDTPSFQIKLRDMISESLSRNISPTQTRNANSYQARTGGQWSPNSNVGQA